MVNCKKSPQLSTVLANKQVPKMRKLRNTQNLGDHQFCMMVPLLVVKKQSSAESIIKNTLDIPPSNIT